MPDGLRLALTTFTVAPLRRPARIDRRTAGQAMALGPLVGLLLGVVAAAVLYVGRQLDAGTGPPLLVCALAVGTLAGLSRGLHLDGLADTVDGLASYRPAEQARAVMRSPEVGPLGVAVLVLVLLTQVGALLAATAAGRGTASLLLAVVVGRLAVAAACTPATPAADRTGLGAMVAGTVSRAVVAVWAGLVAVGAAVYESLDDPADSPAAQLVAAARPVLAVAVALLVARQLRRHCVRRLGGVTGDVLGALVEVTTTVVLVVMALEVPSGIRPD